MTEDEFSDSTMTIAAPSAMPVAGSVVRAYALRQVSGPGAGQQIPLPDKRLVVGRSRAADIQVESPELSREHFTLEHVGGEFVLRDLESRNGVFLNGVKVYSAALRGGDAIQIGGVSFVFLEGF